MGERFEIEGVLSTHQSEPKDDPLQQCLCCRPRGHVFGFGVDLPFEVPSTRGQTAGRPSDWVQQVLYAHRFEPGRRVRLTLELLDEPEPEPAPVEQPQCRCDGGAYGVRPNPFLVHPQCPVHGHGSDETLRRDDHGVV